MSDPLNVLSKLSELISHYPEAFSSGSKDIHQIALLAAKCVFDLALSTESQSQKYVGHLISSLAPELAPQTRSQARANGKRKQSPSSPHAKKGELQVTPLASLFVEGMDDNQIWAQLELRAKHVCETLEEALEGTGGPGGSDDDGLDGLGGMGALDGDEDESLEDEEDEEGHSDEESEEQEEESDEELASREDYTMVEETAPLRDSSDNEDDDDDEADPELDLDAAPSRTSKALAKSSRSKAKGHPELDDGFFDLASFNAEIEEAEARTASRGALGSDDEDEDVESGSVDMFAPVDDSQAFEEDNQEGAGGEAFYKDFFDSLPKSKVAKPPLLPSKTTKVRFHDEVRVKKIKAKGKGLPVIFVNGVPDDLSLVDEYGEEISDDEDERIERTEGSEEESNLEDEDEPSESEAAGDDEFGDINTMERFKDDLFAEGDEQPQSDLSTHEKRMAALREQISALEAENIAKKDWTLMGEATARSRPQNSLLEEDLEFDRVMKVVPVVTEETVQNLEDRIKSRILEGNFDDVVRNRPVNDMPYLPSRFFELQDTKSKQSLAEIYEDEYTAAQTGGVAGEDRDGKLMTQHQEIEKQWESICAKLDALCNVHFTPKQPKATISTVSNVAATTLESALPTSKSTTAMLAPEEVYAPFASAPRSSSELTPAEKRALHNKQRKKKRKAREMLDKTVDKVAKMRGVKNVKKQKEKALSSIVKSGKGVTVIGKKIEKGAQKGRSKA
ncbi:Mpp10 protein [Neolentinus lepideus HHB14362 ss-1]|uniref:U3 small nucleolar ribonucleoprotein protein MPP10 n=1 Tax=Neolentinus lepideus HHB14362 ss-1 TaxID=1314782 RepID=A0A165VZ01_9AGAM|nr:Mpp10 protein [Neolentinus lepideus HHB14362 ss-1]